MDLEVPTTFPTPCPECGQSCRSIPGMAIHYSKHEASMPLAFRVWPRVSISAPDECWEWQGKTDSDGYGRVTVDGTTRQAHRAAYEDARVSPGTAMVLHHCDNPPCCNPEHLYLGDHTDNTRDAVNRGRYRSGSEHPKAKLDEDAVRDIRERAGDVPQSDLASEYGVSDFTISVIVNRKIWQHVE